VRVLKGEEEMKKRRMSVLIITILLAVCMFAGCGNGGGDAETSGGDTPESESPVENEPVENVPDIPERVVDKEGTIIYGMDGSPNTTYNFYVATSGRVMQTTDAIFDKLVFINGTGEVEPRAAESWTWSEDGKEITIKLRENYFHDGTPVTAEDWVWTIKMVCNKQIHEETLTTKICQFLEGCDPATGDELSEDSAGVEVVDDLTFKIKLNVVYNRWSCEISTLSYMIVLPKHCFEEGGEVKADIDVFQNSPEYWAAPIGSGPCKFVEDSLDDFTKLEAHDQYYGYGADGPQFKYLIFQYVSDANQIASKVVSGDLDIAYPGVSNEDAEFYQGNDQIIMVESASEVVQIDINFDCSIVPRNVRLAVNYAMDKKFILDSIYGGRGVVGGGSLVMNTYPYFINEGEERDVEKAKSFFDKAIEDGSWQADRALQLNVPNDTYEACANIVKAGCEEIGLKVDVVRRDSIPTIQENMFFQPTEGYDAVLWSYAPTIDPAKIGIYLDYDHCVRQKFFSRWGALEDDLVDVEAYTEAFTNWKMAATDEEQKTYAEEFQKIENLGTPCISIANTRAIYACGMNVGNKASGNDWIDVTTVNYYNNDIWNWISYQKS
jgi:ABC-type transport system substrate-binding protein